MLNTRARYRVTSSSNASVSPAWDRFTKSNSDTSDCARVASVCMIGRNAPLFHSTPKAVGTETATPLGAIITHQAYDAVAHFKQSLLQHQVLRPADQPGGLLQLRCCIHRRRYCLQGPFQICDGHPDFVQMITAQRCCQLGAREGRVRRQFDRSGLVLERTVLIEQLIDPEREIEGSAIKIVLLEGFVGRRCIIDLGIVLLCNGLILKRLHLLDSV